jgi:hypothetical protein
MTVAGCVNMIGGPFGARGDHMRREIHHDDETIADPVPAQVACKRRTPGNRCADPGVCCHWGLTAPAWRTPVCYARVALMFLDGT